MASRNAVVLGFAGLGVVAAGVAAGLLTGGEAPAPTPEEKAPTEVASATADPAVAAAGPVAEVARPLPAAGDGSIRGRLIRGLAKTPLAGSVQVSGPGFGPLKGVAGADGRFVLDEVPCARPVVLRAEAPGVLPADYPLRVPRSGILDVGDLVLGGPVHIEVRVRDAGDRPVAGATVTLHRNRINPQGAVDWISVQLDPRDGGPAAFTRTADEQGRATFEEAPPGSWFVRASAKGFADDGTTVALVEGAVREPVRIVLGPAGALAGAVLGRDGKPVEGVTVRGFRLNSWWTSGLPDSTCRTAADGKYRLEGLPRGALSVVVDLANGVRLSAGTVDIPAVTTWDIRLGPSAGIRGKVVDDAAGTPVAGVEVTAQTFPESGSGTQGTARTVTAEDGTFLIAGLPPGNLGTLNVRARGFLPYPGAEAGMATQQTRLPEGETIEKEIRLRRGGVLKGRILDRAGKGVPGATVRFKNFNPRMGVEEAPAVRTDAEGAYRIEGVPRLKGLVKVDMAGWFQPDYPLQEYQVLQQGTLPEACSVEVPAEGEGTKDVLVAPAGAVEGLVVDKEGKAAAGMTVSIYSKTKGSGGGAGAISDAEGKFRLEGAWPADDLVATASGPGGLRGASDPFRLAEGESTPGIRITLKAAATLAGRVRREDGASGQGANLRVVPGKKDLNQVWNWNWQRQNSPAYPVGTDGAFRAEGLAPGTYTVVCDAEGAASSEGPVVDLAEGETKEGVEVVLPEEKRISGRVLNPEGAPLAGATLRVRPAALQNQWYGGADNEPVAATADAAGLFTVRGLGKGSWKISARAEGFSESAQTVEGGKDDLVFNLSPGLTIEGIVTEEGSGTPLPGITLWANPKVGGGMNTGRSAVTGKDGAFALKDLTAGAWAVTVAAGWDDPKNDFTQKILDNVEAGTKEVRVSLVKGLPIAGKVKDEAGKAVSGMWVHAVGKDAGANQDPSRQRGGQVQPDGSFRLGGMPAGNYDLTFQSNGMANGAAGGTAPTSVKNVAAGTEDLVVTVKQGLPISGRIQDEKGAPPGQAGNFQLIPSDDASGTGTTWGNFQADGVFTSQPLEPGKSYDIVIHAVAGTMGGTLKGVVGGQKDLVVVLKRGGTISGKVVDETGKAVGAGVPVFAAAEEQPRRNEPGGQAYAATGAGGEFTVSGLGDQRFKVTAGGGNSDFRPTTTTEAYDLGATGLVLKVSAGVTLEGRLVDSKGAWGRPQVWIMATSEGADGGGGSWNQAKEDGSFAIKGLAPGKVKLQVWIANKQTDLGTFEAPGAGLSVTVPD